MRDTAPLGRAWVCAQREGLEESEAAHQVENDVHDLHISLLPLLRVPRQARQHDRKQRLQSHGAQQRGLVVEVTEQEVGIVRALLARIEFLEFLNKIDRLGHGRPAEAIARVWLWLAVTRRMGMRTGRPRVGQKTRAIVRLSSRQHLS